MMPWHTASSRPRTSPLEPVYDGLFAHLRAHLGARFYVPLQRLLLPGENGGDLDVRQSIRVRLRAALARRLRRLGLDPSDLLEIELSNTASSVSVLLRVPE